MSRRSRARLSSSILKEPDRALTPKQAKFVAELLANGGKQGDAARAAGYPPRSADVTASRLVRNPVVQQHLAREMMSCLSLHAVTALHTVATLVSTAQSEYVRLEAARDLMDRAGFRPPDRQQLQIDGQLTVSIELGGSKHGPLEDSHPPSDAIFPPKALVPTKG